MISPSTRFGTSILWRPTLCLGESTIDASEWIARFADWLASPNEFDEVNVVVSASSGLKVETDEALVEMPTEDCLGRTVVSAEAVVGFLRDTFPDANWARFVNGGEVPLTLHGMRIVVHMHTDGPEVTFTRLA